MVGATDTGSYAFWMIVVQHIWSRWTKATRGAHQSQKRPQLLDAYPVRAPEANCELLVHEISTVERDGRFELCEKHEVTIAGSTQARNREIDGVVGLRIQKDLVEVIVTRPSALHTAWPSSLPRPLFSVRPGETACIDWNGRLQWTGRATCFQQHRYWFAVMEHADRNLFIEATPRKHVDLRTHIY